MYKRLLAVFIIHLAFVLAAGNLCPGGTPEGNNGNSGIVPNPAGSEGTIILAQAGGEETQETAVPAILIPENSFDFGTVAQSSKLTHKFVIKNTGEAPLKLISAKGS